jgi:hypothetical protein
VLVIAEHVSGVYSYHLRRVGDEGIKLGGLGDDYPALCGTKLGWDTRFPLTSWKTKDHIPSIWCAECEKLAGDDLR